MTANSWRDDDLVAAWAALLRLHAELVPVIDDELERSTGVSLAWYDVLLELAHADGRRMRMSDLGAAVVLSRTRVSRVVDDLVRAGYVARTPNPHDGRSAFAVLTDVGLKAYRRAAPSYLAQIRRHLSSRLTDRDAAQLRSLLEKALGD